MMKTEDAGGCERAPRCTQPREVRCPARCLAESHSDIFDVAHGADSPDVVRVWRRVLAVRAVRTRVHSTAMWAVRRLFLRTDQAGFHNRSDELWQVNLVM